MDNAASGARTLGLRSLGFTDLQTEKVVVRHSGKDATVLHEFKKPVDIMECP